jgi:hypothetical protein
LRDAITREHLDPVAGTFSSPDIGEQESILQNSILAKNVWIIFTLTIWTNLYP